MVDLKLPLYFLSTKHFYPKFSGNFDACACNPFQALLDGAWFEARITPKMTRYTVVGCACLLQLIKASTPWGCLSVILQNHSIGTVLPK